MIYRVLITACLAVPQLALAVNAADSLPVQIDRLIEAKVGDAKISAPADDAEFLRRVYLDLAGRIPTVHEATSFLNNQSADRRDKLIETLLAGPDYPRRMQELFHVMLMERRGDNEEWAKFLRAAFEQNKPWHLMARAILKPDADNEELRGDALLRSDPGRAWNLRAAIRRCRRDALVCRWSAEFKHQSPGNSRSASS